MDQQKLLKKLQTALKLSGFNIRREFCLLILDKFKNENIDLNISTIFECNVKTLCSSLENQCLNNHSIEKEHIQKAIERCLYSEFEDHETIFNVINAFDFPQLYYDFDKKQYYLNEKKAKLLSNALTKAELFLDRYNTILQRIKRNFSSKIYNNIKDSLKLQTVDYLLTLSYVSLDKILIFGCLIQIIEGKYHLEDPSGIVELDLTHAKFHDGFFAENCFVLVNGQYEDKILHVSTIILPPGEEYSESFMCFNNINYFGGTSPVSLRESIILKDHLTKTSNNFIMFLSDVWLDYPGVFDKLQKMFDGIHQSPPIAFVFMGNFLSEAYDNEKLTTLKKLFKKLGDLINQYPNLVKSSEFVIIPGLQDPCISFVLPRLPLSGHVIDDLKRICPKIKFGTNPCRIQYCNKEIVVFRCDIMQKFIEGSINKYKTEDLSDNITRTIISQGHLSPLSLHYVAVHWAFDYTLRLYPLPDLIVIGDRSEMYESEYKGCRLINPGSFCNSGFQFKSYIPKNNSVDDCLL